MIYWDTSAVLPLYVQEPTSDFWESVLLQAGVQTVAQTNTQVDTQVDTQAKSSALAVTEFHYALLHKVCHKQLKIEAARALMAKFTEDCDLGRWALCPLGSDVIAASLEVAESTYNGASPIPLRSLDGLHLGAARMLRCGTVATGDQRMAEAARRVGMHVLFPD